MTPYRTLEARFNRLGTLGEAAALLQWDAATLMPIGSAPARAEQMATLKVMSHEILTQPDTGDLLSGAEAQHSFPTLVATGDHLYGVVPPQIHSLIFGAYCSHKFPETVKPAR